MFCVKELEKSNQTEFKIEKVINYNSKQEDYDDLLNRRIDKKLSLCKISYFR